MTKKVMELVNNSGKMKCMVCGSEHYAMMKPNSDGKFYRGAWQCRSGCKMDKVI